MGRNNSYLLVAICALTLGFRFTSSNKVESETLVEKASWKDIDELLNLNEEPKNDHRGKALRGTGPTCAIPEDRQQGLCYGEVTCQRLRGKVMGYCSGLDGACCVFYRTCGGRTAQEISHFRNEDWPQDESLKETCSFSVRKKDSSICGLQIGLEKLRLPGFVGKCSSTFMWITGIPRKQIELICGEFSGVNYILNITASTEMFIKIKSYSGFKSSWSVTVKQIPCDEFRYEVLPQIGDGKGDISVEPASITTTSTETSSTSVIPPDIGSIYSSCGLRGPPRNSIPVQENSAEANKIISGLTETKEFSEWVGINENYTRSDVKWAVPELTDSNFYMHQGTTALLGDRITFGQEAGETEFPWQVAIFVGRSFHCGGSIISSLHILTAAHCVLTFKKNPRTLRIVFGKFDISKSHKRDETTIYVDQVLTHPNYSRQTLVNDIAILKLSKEITFSERARPICLPPADSKPEGELAVVTGWGRDENRGLVTKLRKLQSAIIDNKACDKRWGDKGAALGFIVPSMMCMDVQDGDSCNGDSGGPTVMAAPPDFQKYVQVGIVSFGSGSCTDKNLPGVYTRVSYYVDWINTQLN